MRAFLSPAVIVLLCVVSTYAQNTGQLNGSVRDPQGAGIPGAEVEVISSATNARFNVTSNESGEWVVPLLSSGIYRVAAKSTGFRTSVLNEIKVDAGTPTTVNIKMEIGAVAETIEVTGGAEVLQTTNSSVSMTLTGRQINQLPMNSRNAMELIVLLPGTQTPGTARTSSINGLPKGSMNMSLDGVNIQDNYLRSSDGFFATLQPKPDAIEEVTVTTAGGAADVLGQGAAQIRFVTKSGTNSFHGSAFWQHRNTAFNSNYYFNTVDKIARDRLILNQFGGSIGGPIKKDKIFFFANMEWFRLPQSYTSGQLTVPNASAVQGLYTYLDSARVLRTINLYDVARNASVPSGVRPYASTPDPSMLSTMQDILKLADPSRGSLVSRIATANDYNRSNYNFATNGMNKRSFPTLKLDWNVTSKHHLDSTVNYQKYFANPDGVNGILPILPGTGTVLGSDVSGGTRRITFSLATSWRAAWSSSLTSEVRWALNGGNSIFRDEITPDLFNRWGGYAPVISGFVSNPYNATSQSRRNSPVKSLDANFTLVKSNHTINFGGNLTQVNLWQQSIGSQLFPTVTMGIATNDPINTGATNIFTTDNFPNSTPAQRTEAAALYAVLTGRVSSIGRSVSLDADSRQYAFTGSIDRNRQREMALFAQDNWRIRRGLNLTFGLRWNVQFPFENLDGLYTSSGYAGAWGISGVGNLFQPGNQPGVAAPAFSPVTAGNFAYNTQWKGFAPSIGFAWTLPESKGSLRWLTGTSGQSVLRGGYSISTIREGTATFVNILGSNQGRTRTLSVDPNNNPADFGAAGSILFRDGQLPTQTFSATPVWPLPVATNASINEFDPNLKLAYVQSWSFSYQREIFKDTVIDFRYVGNHGTRLWRQVNLNEVNIVENGFLNQFNAAANNLAIARRTTPTSVNYGNQGLTGQVAVPIFQAIGLTNDTTFANYMLRGEAGTAANAIAFNSPRMANLVRAGYPSNLFVANPATNSGAYLMTNGGHSTYNPLQIEGRRRMSKGLLAQGSYVWSKSITNMFASSSAVFSQPTTFRNGGLDKGLSPWDIRHAFKLNYIYELPFGKGRKWLSGEGWLSKLAFDGWEVSGNYRMQSGSPVYLRSGRFTFNSAANQSTSADAGVQLYGLTMDELQSLVQIRKEGNGLVYFLPQSLIDNTLAAMELGGKTLNDLDKSKPYLGPPTTAGQLGHRLFLNGPWQTRVDFGIVKRIPLGERRAFEIRATALNALNDVNFLLGAAGNDLNTVTLNSAQFGQTRSAYRDISVSGSNDPGGRMVEFQLRFVF